MAIKITKDVLESYLNCKYKGHLKLAGVLGTKSDYDLLLESRNHVRLAATDKLVARRTGSEVRRGSIITTAILKQGLPLLLDATVQNKEFSVCFDALQIEIGFQFHFRINQRQWEDY